MRRKVHPMSEDGSEKSVILTVFRRRACPRCDNLAVVVRKGRIEYPRAAYHVPDRGDRREPIVRSDADRAARSIRQT